MYHLHVHLWDSPKGKGFIVIAVAEQGLHSPATIVVQVLCSEFFVIRNPQ